MSTTPSRRGLLAGLSAALLALFSPRPASAAPAPTPPPPPLPPAPLRGFGETVTLTDSASGLPEGLRINPNSGLLTGTISFSPAGQTLTSSACLPPGLSLDGGLTSGYRPLPPHEPDHQ